MAGAGRPTNARENRSYPGWHLSWRSMGRFRRRCRRTATHRREYREEGRRSLFRLRRLQPALQRPDEQRFSHDLFVRVSGHEAYFPDVPINAGTFDPLHIKDPTGLSYMRSILARLWRAAEVSQRIAEAVFARLSSLCPISSPPRQPALAVTLRSAATTLRRTDRSSCTKSAAADMAVTRITMG